MILVNHSAKYNQELDAAIELASGPRRFQQNLATQDTPLSLRGPGSAPDLRKARGGLTSLGRRLREPRVR
eukprot:8696701-Pyramimonas_sp.AAC.1